MAIEGIGHAGRTQEDVDVELMFLLNIYVNPKNADTNTNFFNHLFIVS